jgi:hypothetical protein
MEQNELPVVPHHIGSPFGVAKNISVTMVHSAQTNDLPGVEINTVSKQIEVSFHLSHDN